MPVPGLVFVTSRRRDTSKISDEQFDRFYKDEQIPAALKFMRNSGYEQLALRYKNVDTDSSRPYLALYPSPDASRMLLPEEDGFLERTKRSKALGGNVFDLIEFDFRPYEKIQTFEGYETGSKERGQTIVCVAMEPGSSKEQEQDFEDWYKMQHLDMLSMCRGYLRCTRYRRLDGHRPRYLALHEYSCKPSELPAEQIKQVTATEWTQKILKEAQLFERDVFELVEVQGEVKAKL